MSLDVKSVRRRLFDSIVMCINSGMYEEVMNYFKDRLLFKVGDGLKIIPTNK